MKLHPTIADLVKEIDAFIEREGITATEFGWRAIKDPNLYRSLRKGRNPRLETMDRIRAFMRERRGVAA
ncbi:MULTISPECIES: hypothetical protein [unclassified Bradyrhizobium]